MDLSRSLVHRVALHSVLALAGFGVWEYLNRTEPGFWFRFKFYDHMDVLWPAYGFVLCTLAPSLLILAVELAWKRARERVWGGTN